MHTVDLHRIQILPACVAMLGSDLACHICPPSRCQYHAAAILGYSAHSTPHKAHQDTNRSIGSFVFDCRTDAVPDNRGCNLYMVCSFTYHILDLEAGRPVPFGGPTGTTPDL